MFVCLQSSNSLNKTYMKNNKTILVKLDEETYNAIKQLAEKDMRPLSGFIRMALIKMAEPIVSAKIRKVIPTTPDGFPTEF